MHFLNSGLHLAPLAKVLHSPSPLHPGINERGSSTNIRAPGLGLDEGAFDPTGLVVDEGALPEGLVVVLCTDGVLCADGAKEGPVALGFIGVANPPVPVIALGLNWVVYPPVPVGAYEGTPEVGATEGFFGIPHTVDAEACNAESF